MLISITFLLLNLLQILPLLNRFRWISTSGLSLGSVTRCSLSSTPSASPVNCSATTWLCPGSKLNSSLLLRAAGGLGYFGALRVKVVGNYYFDNTLSLMPIEQIAIRESKQSENHLKLTNFYKIEFVINSVYFYVFYHRHSLWKPLKIN